MEVLQLKDGTRLFGVSLQNQQDDTVRFLLRTAWLKEHAPAILEAAEQQSNSKPEPSNGVRQRLQQHIERLRADDEQNIEKIGYLEERLAGLKPAAPGPEEESDVVILKLPASLIRTHLRRKQQLQQLAGLGILNGLTTVESVSSKDLEAELRQLGPESLIRNLPAEIPAQDDRVLRLILLNADRMLGRTSRIIYQSGRYISEAEAEADPQALAVDMLSGQLEQLQQLLQDGLAGAALKPGANGPAAAVLPRQAAEIARREQADVVDLTQMDLNAAAGTAQVSIAVYHHLPDEPDWKLVASVTATADRTDITDDQQQHIADDPRVQQVTQLFRGLGIRSTDLTQAISIGAVVETAQQRAREQLAAKLQLQAPMAEQQLRVQEAELQELPD
ncbi:MAG: hypothetical protein RIK87_13875 [Fuerstiella sp.]